MTQSTTNTGFEVKDGGVTHRLRINGRFLYDENGVVEATFKPNIPYIYVDYRDSRGPIVFKLDRSTPKYKFDVIVHSCPFNLISFQGGLGNNIFQLAFGLYLEKQTGVKSLFTSKGKLNQLFRFSEPNAEHLSVETTQVKEQNDSEMQRSLTTYFNSYLGYFQDPKKYVLPILPRLRSCYKFKDSNLSDEARKYLDEIKSNESVAVHVRRGDYLNEYNSKIFNSADVDWYKNAFKKLGEVVEDFMNTKFFIFSDDINWCKNAFSFLDRAVFVEGTSDIEDFHLIKSCKHFIVPNSTFSYSAMILSESEGARISMKSWFRDFDKTRSKIHILFPGVIYL